MPKSLSIGFIGNFVPGFSTENDRAWSFRKLGHTVTEFQENLTTKEHLLKFLPEADLLLYSHTHDPSWEIEGLRDVFKAYKDAGIPTASAHLDRWLWLEREKDMGQEATWFTEYIFMADGSPEAAKKYDELGLNWHWLKPGVVERDCYMAKPDRDRFPHDVIFVGSKGYHPEWPGRPRLIDFLAKTYGERFGHYGNDGIGVVRGKDLNTLYASAKVVVGDSCFGGRPRYWSDRIAETTGRGGFILHPRVEGLDHIGVPSYEFKDLKGTIEYYLLYSGDRELKRLKAHEWTKNNATYSHRAKGMISVMGLAR